MTFCIMFMTNRSFILQISDFLAIIRPIQQDIPKNIADFPRIFSEKHTGYRPSAKICADSLC